MVKLDSLTSYYSKGLFSVSDVFWCSLEGGYSNLNFKTPAAGFLYVLKGEGKFTFDGTEYSATPGTILHGGCQMNLDYETSPKTDFEYCLIHYTCEANTVEKHTNSHYKLQVHLNHTLLELLKSLHTNSVASGPLSAFRSRILFYQLLYESIVSCQNESHSNEQTNMVHDAIRYFQLNYNKSITLTDMANRYGVSQGFFSSQFRYYNGLSPIDYLIKFRIKKAKELLSFTHHSVLDIAKTIGYADVYYFSRLFKKHTGMSPSVYRKYHNQR
ncbi:AraC family transcriptional regulator [Alkalihalobacillus hemicellulosilyticus]|uniref:DNA-binding response regulator n=1 Tax=Halalkalibacter hemicellulosilyticusJCM 9152 TaxID=1236971 RepID=W4Q9R0_9BACI|nr:AraC family transcriptional regulator [Halalkalibacter hemicellulosilyticus]GAE28740.1 DNA-binding response regulator [Halalkalibacter hemicellulosilyticusJCM 9152]